MRRLVECVLVAMSITSPVGQSLAAPTAALEPGACGPTPSCAAPPQCVLRELTATRDTRDCTLRIHLIVRIAISDPACEAEKAAVNQKIEAQRAVFQQDYRQCLVSQDAHRVQCELRQTEWEACIAKAIPQFPPKSLGDRKYLYQRCAKAGGKDEFTSDCCSHLYSADRTTLGLCRP